MSDTKHTPGPWWYSKNSNEIGTAPRMDVKICGWVSGANPEEKEANAQLIEASPAMLETLKEIARCSVESIDHVNKDWIHDLAVDAITKAEGEVQ